MSTAGDSLFSHSSSTPPWNYDVFLNFRGKDTRYKFTDHLSTALKDNGIMVFMDKELERGKEIHSHLLKKIEESRFSIVVFLPSYAASHWCLDELDKIVECLDEKRQIVFPVFYEVDTTDVRNQKGSYQKDFDEQEKAYKNVEGKVQRWRTAMKRVAGISGFSVKNKPEADVIRAIVGAVKRELNLQGPLGKDHLREGQDDVRITGMYGEGGIGNTTIARAADDMLSHQLIKSSCFPENVKAVSDKRGLIGIDHRVRMLNFYLGAGQYDVRIIGMYGEGGIGKTTIVRAAYDMLSRQFKSRCFLANVKEVSEKHGLVPLQNQLLSEVLDEGKIKVSDVYEGMDMISIKLRHKKVLIILDDVDKLEQLKMLVGNKDWFGSGSRIIVTTTVEHLLKLLGVDATYKAKELSNEESLELFSWKTFKKKQPAEGFERLSNELVSYAKGLPLAIEVFGSFLSKRSEDDWRITVERMKDIPKGTGNIMYILQKGFNGLEEMEKKLFLDIACFFKGSDRDHVTKMLSSCNFNTDTHEIEDLIQALIDKSLIKVSGNKLWMHDMLQIMGQEIVRQVCIEEPGKRSRLWTYEDVDHVLMKNTGTEAIESIVLDLPEKKEAQWNAEGFSKMSKLRLLKVYNVQVSEGPKCLPNGLQFLEWQRYPSKSLPSSCQPNQLSELNMCHSKLEQLWNGEISLGKLKFINLSHSKCLIKTPDFTGIPNLQRLILEGCTSLYQVHRSIGRLKKLIYLNLTNCKNLGSLPSSIEMESLQELILSGCSNLRKFPTIIGNMECLSKLYLDGTSIKELPSSIGYLKGLVFLNLRDCKNLKSLPSNIKALESLTVDTRPADATKKLKMQRITMYSMAIVLYFLINSNKR